jgi:hypothetical protein
VPVLESLHTVSKRQAAPITTSAEMTGEYTFVAPERHHASNVE